MSLLPLSIHAEGFTHGIFNQPSQNINKPQLIKLSADSIESLRINFNELFQTESTQLLQSTHVTAHSQSAQLSAAAQLQVPELKPNIEKRIPNLWRVIIPSDWPVIAEPVRVQWQAQTTDNNNRITTKLVPWIQRTTQLKEGQTIIEGGVKLLIKTSTIRSNEPISGQVNIELNYF